MEEGVDRLTLGRMQNPVRGFLHGSAALLSVAGTVFLWMHSSGGMPRRLALLTFGLSLVALYTVSSLYHSVPWSQAWKQRMQRLDHSMIYVLVAGTYTPIASIVLDGSLRWAVLATVWGIALAGAIQKTVFPTLGHWFSITLQTTQGWIGLPVIAILAQRLPSPAIVLVVLGGVLYTIGMVFFVTQRPRLWPHVFSHHEVFHVFVIAGSAAHYAMTFAYVARFSG